MKVVIDTNVLISGQINPQGPPGRVVALLLKGEIEIFFDERILAEYERVLNYPQFPFSKQEISALLELIRQMGIYIIGTPLPILLPDASDQPFLEVARAAKAEALITGNLRHFPNIAEAISASDFLVYWLNHFKS